MFRTAILLLLCGQVFSAKNPEVATTETPTYDETEKAVEIPIVISPPSEKPNEHLPEELPDEIPDKVENKPNGGKGKTIDAAMDAIFAEIGKLNLGIEHLNSLKRENKCEVHEQVFRCEASADKAAIQMDPDHQMDVAIKLMVWGKIRDGRIVKIRMEDAIVDVKKMPPGMSMWRPTALRQLERQLKRRYLRMAIATRRMGRRLLPIEVNV